MSLTAWQWQRSMDDGQTWTDIAGAIASTYRLVQADVGHKVRVVVSGSSTVPNSSVPDKTFTGQPSLPTVAVADVDDAATGTVTITGTAMQGQTLAADTSSIRDADGLTGVIYSYQWWRGTTDQGVTTWRVIDSATASTYTLVQADVGHTVQVVVSFDDAEGNTETLTSTASAVVTDVNEAATGAVTITGTAEQGQTLSAAGLSSIVDADGLPRNVVYSYQWQRGTTDSQGTTWADISGATGASYTLTQADVGQKVRVVVSFDDAEGNTETLTSTASAAVANVNEAATGAVTIAGTVAQGQTLTAGVSSIADADGLTGVVYSYQWQRGTTDQGETTWTNISGATASSYRLVQADVGQKVRVVVSFEDALGGKERLNSAASVAVADVNEAATGSLGITGTAEQGQTVTVTGLASIADADGLTGVTPETVRWQWQRGTTDDQDKTIWTDISDATGLSYTLVQADVGHTVRLVVSFEDDGGNTETLISTASAAVVNVNDAATGSLGISGTAEQGQTLTAEVSSIRDADGLTGVTPRWQWQRGTTDNQGTITWVDISDATASTYRLVQADVGHVVRLVVRFRDALGGKERLISTATGRVTGTVADVNEAATGMVTITGTAAQGQTLRAAPSSVTDADGEPSDGFVYRYQWQRGSFDENARFSHKWIWTNISGETGESYTLVQADVDHVVRVVVRFRDALGGKERLNSTETDRVVNVNDEATGTVTITGTAEQGQELSAALSSVADIDGEPFGGFVYGYQWQRSTDSGTTWADITSATASSYTLVPADVGHVVRLVVRFEDALGGKERLNSAATDAVANNKATGSLGISGTAEQGQELSAALGSVTDADGAPSGGFVYRYQWQRGTTDDQGKTTWAAISGATGASYRLVQADVGHVVRLVVRFEDALGGKERLNSDAVGPVADVNDEATGTVTITGTVAQGQELSAAPSSVTDADGEPSDGFVYRYQWQRGSFDENARFSHKWIWTNISGETGESYTLVQADVDHVVRVVVRFRDALGGKERLNSTETDRVVNVNDEATGTVTITGTAEQGQELSAALSSVADIDGEPFGGFVYGYQWQRSTDSGTTWADITSATASSYTLVPADVGHVVRLVVRFEDALGGKERLNSAATDAVANNKATGSLGISGTAEQGQELSAALGSVTDADGAPSGGFVYRYQWQRGTTDDQGKTTWAAISGATGASYRLVQADVGHVVRLVVRFEDALGGKERLNSDAVGPVADVNDEATGTVTITGTVAQGQELSAAPSSVTDADGEPSDGFVYRYQWQRGSFDENARLSHRWIWANISGATASSYTLVQADVDQQVRVVVRFRDALGGKEKLISAGSGRVTNVNDAATGPVTITGTAKQGQALQAEVSSIRDADGTPLGGFAYRYQWQRGTTDDQGETTWTNIASATASSYALVQADVGQKVRVVVRFDDADGNTETLTSTASAAVVNVNDAATGPVTIAGTVTQGQTLTAGVSSIADADGLTGVVYSYQWQRGSFDENARFSHKWIWTNISGETGESYRLVQADVDHVVRVVVRFRDALGGKERLNSTETDRVVNVNDEATGAVTIAGTAAQGQTLTAGVSSVADADGIPAGGFVYRYQWQRGTTDNQGTITWAKISGATGASYRLVQADVDHVVRVVVRFTDALGGAERLISAATDANIAATGTVVNVNTAATGTVTITGTAEQGEALQAEVSSIRDADGAPSDGFVYRYQWQRGTTDNQGTITWAKISDATGASYRLVQADVGQQVRVVVRFTDAEGNAERLTSAATHVNIAATGMVTITGTAAQGQTLRAAPSSVTDADGEPSDGFVYRYQWQRGSFDENARFSHKWIWTNISGETGESYTLVQADVDHVVRVVVRFRDALGAKERLNSTETDRVVNVNDEATGTVTITGTAEQGQELSAALSSVADIDGEPFGGFVYGYQWQRSTDSGTTWADITSATASSYTLVPADVGHVVRLVVRFEDALGGKERLNSAATDAVTNVNTAATGSLGISGTATQGQALQAEVSSIRDADGLTRVTPRWQWQRGSTDDQGKTTWADISDATASGYRLVQADVGQQVRVVVRFEDDAGNTETLTSTATGRVTAAVADVNIAATGPVAITGTAVQGQVLTADTNSIQDADGMPSGGFVYRYQWQRGTTDNQGKTTWAAISGATGASYTLVQADVDHVVRVVVRFTDALGGKERLKSTATGTVTAAVADVNDAATGTVTITGTVAQGQELSAAPSSVTDADGMPSSGFVYSYQWQRGSTDDQGKTTWADIFGATVSGYRLVPVDVGHTVRVVVRFTDAEGNAERLTSTATGRVTGTVTDVNDAATGTVTITGTAAQGQTLSAALSSIDDIDGEPSDGFVYSYQWQRSTDSGTIWTDIASATASSYRLVQADVGHTVRVVVRFTDALGGAERLTSDAVGAVTNNKATGPVTIAGTAEQGQTLTAGVSSIADADGLTGVVYSYQWQRGTTDQGTITWVDIDSATTSSYRLVQADVGHTVRAVVRFEDALGGKERLTSDAVGAVTDVNIAATGPVTITGTAVQGQVLTADTNSIQDADGLTGVVYSYQWQRGTTDQGVTTWADISGETASSYTLVPADVGHTVQVVVSFTDAEGNTETLTSAETGTVTAAVTDVNIAATGPVTITGTVTQGQTLTAEVSSIRDADGAPLDGFAYRYQWQRGSFDEDAKLSHSWSWANISGATAKSYKLGQADVDHVVRVVVRFRDALGGRERLNSTETDRVVNVDDAATGPVTITGTAVQGQVLTADTNSIQDADGMPSDGFVYSYQWQRGTTDNQGKTTWAAISGATGASYTLVQADVDHVVRVVVRFTDALGGKERLKSTATGTVTAAVADVNNAATGTVTITGTVAQGQELSAAPSSVTDADGMPSSGFVYSYQWQRGSTDDQGKTTWADIFGATVSGYRLVPVDVGHTVRVVVRFTDAEGNAERLTSTATGRVTGTVTDVNDAATGTVTITGTAAQGQTLSAALSSIDDIDGEPSDGFVYSYQWQRSTDSGTIWTDIASATASSYRLVQADVGHTVRVVVRFTDALGGAERLTSDAVGAVANVNDEATGAVAIAGTVTQGQTLTAGVSSVADADGEPSSGFAYRADADGIPAGGFVYSYQWQRGTTDDQGTITWVDIDSATTSSYRLTQADVGHTVRVVVRFEDALGGKERLTSDAVGAVTDVNEAATGSLGIAGTAEQGQTLSAAGLSSIVDADGAPSSGFVYSYQWQRGTTDQGVTTWADISGATGASYRLTQADVGHTVRVVVSFDDADGNTETLTSTASAAVVNVNDEATGAVTIAGTAEQGQTLTADTSGIRDADGLPRNVVYSYQWQRGTTDSQGTTWADITSATASSYRLTQADVGHTVRVVVNFEDALGGKERLTSDAVGAVANVNEAATGAVTITGTAEQGQTLTATAPSSVADADGIPAGGFVYSYQWQRGTTDQGTITWADIDSATTSSYRLVQADVGHTVRVVVRFEDALGGKERLNSAASVAVADVNEAATGAVTITGTAEQGQTLTADTSGIRDADGLPRNVVYSYQWQRGTTDSQGTTWADITSATASSYRLTQADVGHTVRVVVNFEDALGGKERLNSAASVAVADVNEAATGSLGIAGTAEQGQTLSAAGLSSIVDADGAPSSGFVYSYQWQRGTTDQGVTTWADISGATGASYRLTQADVGHTVRVVVSFDDADGNTETLTSTASAAVVNVNDEATGAVAIAGTVTQGQTLTAGVSSVADADGVPSSGFAYRYQWQRGTTDQGTITWADIDSATTSSYRLVQADVGQKVRVVVRFEDAEGNTETLTSTASAAVVNVNDEATGTVAITGTVTQGQTLTAGVSSVADADGIPAGGFVYSYQWQRGTTDQGETTWTNISGATASSYRLVQADVGQKVRVVVRFEDALGGKERLTSDAVGAVTDVNEAATGSLGIAGTAEQGQTLSAAGLSSIVDADGAPSSGFVYSYQWQRGTTDQGVTTWADISGATGASYRLTQADVGHTVRVVVSFDDADGNTETLTSTASAAVVNVNDEATGAVTIAGTAEQGQTLSAAGLSSIVDADGAPSSGFVYSYQWQRGTTDQGVTTWADISGATGASYRLTQADVGHTVRVVVSFDDADGNTETLTSTASAAVVNVNDEATGAVTIAGTAEQGQTLSAAGLSSIVDADGAPSSGFVYSYQWQRGTTDQGVTTWADISGATGASYRLTQADVGQKVRVVVSFDDADGNTETLTSTASAAVVNVNDEATGAVTIAGTAEQGQTLSAAGLSSIVDADGAPSSGFVYSYQWQRGTTDQGVTTWADISGATGASYRLTQADVGQKVRVVVSFDDADGNTETLTSTASAAVANVNEAATGAVTITGTAEQGQTLSAAGLSSIVDADGAPSSGFVYSYQWQRGTTDQGVTTWADISGATGASYRLTQADVGHTVRVVVRFEDAEGNTETLTSTASAAVVNVNDEATGTVAITGTAVQGQTLMATAPSSVADADGIPAGGFVYSYQWQRGTTDSQGTTWADITSATASSYRLTQADVGHTVQVVVSFDDADGNTETLTSTASAAVVNVNDEATGTVAITGTAVQGQTLMATAPSSVADADGIPAGGFVYSYQWQRGTTDSQGTITWADIDSATTSSYRLVQADVGHTVRVVVRFEDALGGKERLNSAASVAVADVNEAATGSLGIAGTAEQGQTLSAAGLSSIVDADGAPSSGFVYSYQWQRGTTDQGVTTWADISGATGASYRLTQADVGHTVRVVVSFDDADGNTETLTSTASAAVVNVNDEATGAVAIAGTVTQGQTLTAGVSSVADADGVPSSGFAYRYQWQRGTTDQGTITWVDIDSATTSSYRLVQADVGQKVRVVVRFEDAEGNTETLTSTASAAVVNVNDEATGTVAITGTAVQGQTLTATAPSSVADADGIPAGGFVYSYQWQRGTTDQGETTWTNISGATASSYRLVQADVGQKVRVVVRFEDALGGKERLNSAASVAVADVNEAATGSLGIAGTAEQGQTLTAGVSSVADADGVPSSGFAYRYQWQRGTTDQGVTTWADISGATGASYRLTQADVGHTVRVVVSFDDADGNTETLTSTASAAVVNVNDEATGALGIAGMAEQGQTLSAAGLSSIVDADGAPSSGFVYSYQWQRGTTDQGETTWTNISGATASSYRLVQADVGQKVRVVVRFEDALGGKERLNSAATGTVTAAVTDVNTAATGAVAIAGTVTQGQTLTAGVSSVADADGVPSSGFAYRYQWQRGTTDQGTITWVDIDSATTSSYRLVQADVGQKVRVVVRFEDAEGNTETLTSTASAAVVNVNDEATGTVAITGTAVQGQTLMATAPSSVADADGIPAGGFVYSYQWQRGTTDQGTITWADIDSATTSSYRLVQADVGQKVRVVVRFEDALGGKERLNSAATGTVTAAVTDVNTAATGAVTIAGTAEQGQTLSAAGLSSIVDADGAPSSGFVYSYQWQRGTTDSQGTTWADISGATTSSYRLTQADVGHTVQVVVSFDDADGNTETLTSTASAAVVNVNDEATGTVAITGTAVQGQTLMATAPSSVADADGIPAGGFVYSYQWQRGTTDSQGTITWADIDSATTSSYRLVQADVGQKVRVVVRFEDALGGKERLNSAATGTVTAAVTDVNTAATGAVTIAGTAEQGQTLSAAGLSSIVDADGAPSSGFVYSYQWQRGTTDQGVTTWADISGATGASYTLTQADVGHTVQVVVSFDDAEGNTETLTSTASAAVVNVNDEATGTVAITGTAVQGQTLMATAPSSVADADGIPAGGFVYSYQWQRGTTDSQGTITWADIDSATTSSYRLVQADVGQKVRVVVRFEDALGGKERLNSAATGTVTAAVTDVNTAATGAVTIAGTAEQGQTLSAAGLSSIVDADGAPSSGFVYSYQWQRGTTDSQGTTWADISGATGASYTLTQADVGHTVQVVVSFDDAEGNTETLTSTASAAVVNVNDEATGTVTITGTAEQGQTLTADTSGIRDADGLPRNVVYSYQWQRGTTDSQGTITWADIDSATTSSYRLTQADVGQKVRVVVRFDDDAGNAETLTSAASAAVANVNEAATGPVYITGTAAEDETLDVDTSSIRDDDGLTYVVYRYQWERGSTDNQGKTTWRAIDSATRFEL